MRGLRQLLRAASARAGTPAAPSALAASRRLPDLAPRARARAHALAPAPASRGYA